MMIEHPSTVTVYLYEQRGTFASVSGSPKSRGCSGWLALNAGLPLEGVLFPMPTERLWQPYLLPQESPRLAGLSPRALPAIPPTPHFSSRWGCREQTEAGEFLHLLRVGHDHHLGPE